MIKITGYRNSADEVADLALRVGGTDGYWLLVDESVKILENSEPGKLLGELSDEDAVFALTAWDKICNELRTRLEAPTGETASKESPDDTELAPNLLLTVDGAIRIMRCVALHKETREPGRISKSRDRVSHFSKEIYKLLPLNDFIFQIKLSEGKYESVSF